MCERQTNQVVNKGMACADELTQEVDFVVF